MRGQHEHVPVPGLGRLALEAAQERVVHNRGRAVLQDGRHVQDVAPDQAAAACMLALAGPCSSLWECAHQLFWDAQDSLDDGGHRCRYASCCCMYAEATLLAATGVHAYGTQDVCTHSREPPELLNESETESVTSSCRGRYSSVLYVVYYVPDDGKLPRACMQRTSTSCSASAASPFDAPPYEKPTPLMSSSWFLRLQGGAARL